MKPASSGRVARAAEVLRPKVVIAENVPAVLLDRGKVVHRAVNWLEEIGYQVSQDVMLLTKFSVPQIRRRHILVATLKGGFDLARLADANARAMGDCDGQGVSGRSQEFFSKGNR